jgi:hypothetical protein
MCKVPAYEVNAYETHVAEVYAADTVYTAEMHACPFN